MFYPQKLKVLSEAEPTGHSPSNTAPGKGQPHGPGNKCCWFWTLAPVLPVTTLITQGDNRQSRLYREQPGLLGVV